MFFAKLNVIYIETQNAQNYNFKYGNIDTF